MKNISRRVFIKGMAVAAVATAASTVLTGCKLPSGVTEGEVETGTTSQTISLANKADKVDLSVTVTGYEYIEKAGVLAVSLKLVNKGNADVLVKDTLASGTDTVLVPAALFDTDPATPVKVVKTASTYTDNLAETGKNTITKQEDYFPAVVDGNLYYTVADKDWKSVTIEFLIANEGSGTAKNYDKKSITINR